MAAGAGLKEDIQESERLQHVMGADLERVSQRVFVVTALSYPVASSIIHEIVLAGGTRLRPLGVLLQVRENASDERLLRPITQPARLQPLHFASLLHANTTGRAVLRRGKPA